MPAELAALARGGYSATLREAGQGAHHARDRSVARLASRRRGRVLAPRAPCLRIPRRNLVARQSFEHAEAALAQLRIDLRLGEAERSRDDRAGLAGTRQIARPHARDLARAEAG